MCVKVRGRHQMSRQSSITLRLAFEAGPLTEFTALRQLVGQPKAFSSFTPWGRITCPTVKAFYVGAGT